MCVFGATVSALRVAAPPFPEPPPDATGMLASPTPRPLARKHGPLPRACRAQVVQRKVQRQQRGRVGEAHPPDFAHVEATCVLEDAQIPVAHVPARIHTRRRRHDACAHECRSGPISAGGVRCKGGAMQTLRGGWRESAGCSCDSSPTRSAYLNIMCSRPPPHCQMYLRGAE